MPDISLLPDLACILSCSVDMLLGGHSGTYRRRITVGSMRQALLCIRQVQDLLGADHFMYRAMVDALDQRMNSHLESAFGGEAAMDAYVCEALLACIEQGDYVDAHDVRRHVTNESARDYTLCRMQALGLK